MAELMLEKKQGGLVMVSSFFAATEEALAPIQTFLGAAVEALPVNIKPPSTLQRLFLLHPLVSAQLSPEAEVTRLSNGAIMSVKKFAFTDEELAGKHFFCAAGGGLICSAEFRAMIEAAKITGLGFDPLPGYES